MAKKLSELTAVTTLADADVMYAAQSPFGAMDSKKITVGNLKTVFGGGGGGAADVTVQTMVDPQVNISSQGVTTTDTVGNTYQEPAGQTRITLDNTRTLSVICGLKISGHVSAGLGTFELYNFTDSTSLGAVTTTSTVETSISQLQSSLYTNKGDQITIRVKNSGAGNTTTIDCGGLFSCDVVMNPVIAVYAPLQSPIAGSYATSVKYAVIKNLSTNTGTFYVAHGFGGLQSGATVENLGASFSETAHGTIITRTPTKKVYAYGGLLIYATALGGSGGFNFFASYELKVAPI